MEKFTSKEKNLIKAMIALVLLSIITIGVVMKVTLKSNLRAEEPTSLIELTSGKVEFDPSAAVESGDVVLSLTSKENVFLKIPDNEAFDLAVKDENSEYVIDAPRGFSEEEVVKRLKGEKESQSSEDNLSKLIETKSILFHKQDGDEGYTYIHLNANESLKVAFHHTKHEEKVVVAGTDLLSGERQVLFTFGASNGGSKKRMNIPKGEPSEPNVVAAESSEEQEEEVDYDSPEFHFSPLRSGPGASMVGVKTAEIDESKLITGQGNFDSDDEPGHDSSEFNRIVRAQDWISYEVKLGLQTIAGQQQLTDVKYRVKAEFPRAAYKRDGKDFQYVQFLGNKLRYEQDGSYTGYQYQEGSLPTSDGHISVSLMLMAQNVQNGDQIKPIVTIELISGVNSQGQTVEIGTTTSPIPVPVVTASAKPSFKAIIGTDPKLRVSYDNTTNTRGSYAYSQVFAVSLALVPLEEGRTDIKGATFPEGEVTGVIKSSSKYTDDLDATATQVLSPSDQTPPQVMTYGVLDSREAPSGNTENFTKTAEFENITVNPQSSNYQSPDAVFSQRGGSNSVTNSSPFVMKNTGINEMSFSFTNPAMWNNPKKYTDNATAIEPGMKFVAAGFGVMKFPFDYLKNRNGGIQTSYQLTSVTYTDNGRQVTKPNVSEIIMSADNATKGNLLVYNTFLGSKGEKLGSSIKSVVPAGDERSIQGENIILKSTLRVDSLDNKYAEGLAIWNGGMAKLDLTKPLVFNTDTQDAKYKNDTVQYGVLKNGKTFPGLDADDFDTKKNQFKWFDDPKEAEKNGTIVAIYSKYLKDTVESSWQIEMDVPLRLISGTYGVKAEDGTPNVSYTLGRMVKEDGEVLVAYPRGNISTFKPTQYDDHGLITDNQVPQSTYGDTLYIDAMQTRISVEPENQYANSTEPVKWIVRPKITVSDNDDYNITITSKLEESITYVRGSAKFRGNTQAVIGDPTIVRDSNGKSTLTWHLVYNKKTSNLGDFEFLTVVDPFKIYWGNGLNTKADNTMVITGANATNPDIYDKEPESIRTSVGTVSLLKSQELAISISSGDLAIEVGSEDPSSNGKIDEYGNPTLLDDIHYNMYMINGTDSTIENARILDVFPDKNDGRGTTYQGKLKLLNSKFVGSHSSIAKIYYTTSNIAADTNPLSIDLNSGWREYTSDSKTPVADIRAVMVVANTLQANETISLDMIVRPEGQKVGDVFVNSVNMNSKMDVPIRSGQMKTVVNARTLSGKAWVDSNKNGVIDANEDALPNTPIRLYRKSIQFKDTDEVEVKKDILGNDFSGMKTDNSGNYKFNNLPEGMYRVEFTVGKESTSTTKDDVANSTDVTTSKVNPVDKNGIASTDPFMEPVLSSGMFATSTFDLAGLNGGFLSETQLVVYKYISGLIDDANEDYQPDDPNDIKADGSLANHEAALSGAEFELQSVTRNKQTNEIIKTEKIGEATSDTNGRLDFSLTALPSDTADEEHFYQLVEKKAPDGYELLKYPVELKTSWGQTNTVYVGNLSQSKLPYTGTNKIMQSILIVAGSILLMGLSYVGFQLFKWEGNW